jgi:hypothetical protein
VLAAGAAGASSAHALTEPALKARASTLAANAPAGARAPDSYFRDFKSMRMTCNSLFS